MNRFYIIGSLNMDMTVYVPHFPHPGETLIGEEMRTLPGGKGANQAVALARLGAHTQMFGKIGNDQLGKNYAQILRQEHIDDSHIDIVDDISTGIAFIEVERPTAQNRIIIIPGANSKVDSAYIQKSISYILDQYEQYSSDTHIVLLQLEIPIPSVLEALTLLETNKYIITILDPAPVPSKIPNNFYTHVDYLTPNETETFHLTGVHIIDESDAKKAGTILIERGCNHVIIKAGKKGAYFVSSSECFFVPQTAGIPAVDTTAAGDSFNAGLAYALGEKKSIKESILFANQVAGLSTTKEGAQAAMPTLSQIQSYFFRDNSDV